MKLKKISKIMAVAACSLTLVACGGDKEKATEADTGITEEVLQESQADTETPDTSEEEDLTGADEIETESAEDLGDAADEVGVDDLGEESEDQE